MGIHLQNKHKYRNAFGDLNIQHHDFNNGDALTFKDNYTALLLINSYTQHLCDVQIYILLVHFTCVHDGS